jgi:hypothetical protein
VVAVSGTHPFDDYGSGLGIAGDRRGRPHPEIVFVLDKDGRPQAAENTAVDIRVPSRGRLVVWLIGYKDALLQNITTHPVDRTSLSVARHPDAPRSIRWAHGRPPIQNWHWRWLIGILIFRFTGNDS